MPILDPKFLASKQGLVSSLRGLKAAVTPLNEAARAGLLTDPGGRLTECGELVDGELAKLVSNRFRIGIFGLVKAGKSTLINALAEEYVTEVDSLPATTAALHLVRRAGKPIVHHLQGSGKPDREITREEAVRILDEKGNPNNVEQVDYVDYPVDLKYLEEDVVLVDTPGLGYILKTISERAGRELHESVHAVVLVLRVFGGQPWQREIREFLAEAVQRVPRVFVVINANETRPDEWGDEAFGRIRERFVGELKESGRVLRSALEDGTISLHFVSALQGASALLRLRTAGTSGADAAQLQKELEQSRFLEFRNALAAFAGGDKRLWDDLRFRARGLGRQIEGLRESVKAQVVVHLESERARVETEQKKLTEQLTQLEAGMAGVKDSVGLETEDLIGELAEKAQTKAEEFIDESVGPAVERWIGTGDTPAQLEAELSRLTESWQPQLQGFMDKRRQAFAKRMALKIRSDLFHRLSVAVDVDTDVPLQLADIARLPTYDITDSMEQGLSRWLTYFLAAVLGLILWSACGPDLNGKALGAVGGVVGTLVVGKLLIRGAVSSSFRSFLRTRRIPAVVKGFFHEAAIRKLTDTKSEMRKVVKDGFNRRRDQITTEIGGAISKALDGHHKRLADDWGAKRDGLAKRGEQLKVLTVQVNDFVPAADGAVKAAASAAE